MKKLFLSNVSQLLDESPENTETINKLYNALPECRKKKADKLKIYSDRVRSIIAGTILAMEYDVENNGPFVEEYGQQGKPYVKDWDIKYSISHSGDYVLVGFSDKNIGVDIQQHKQLKADIVSRFYHEDEKLVLKECDKEQYIKKLFDIWALKEGYIKYTGKGLSQGMASFSVLAFINDEGNEKAYLYDALDNYSIAVVGEASLRKTDIITF